MVALRPTRKSLNRNSGNGNRGISFTCLIASGMGMMMFFYFCVVIVVTVGHYNHKGRAVTTAEERWKQIKKDSALEDLPPRKKP